MIIMSVRNIFFLFALASYLLMTNSYAAEPSMIRLSECSWAWFLSLSAEGKIDVAIASTNVVRPGDYAVKPETYKSMGNKPISLSAPLGTEMATTELKQHWDENVIPMFGLTVPLFMYTYSLKSREIIKESLPVFLPCLHPDPLVPCVHLGSGNKLLAGDLPSWTFWSQSRLFKNRENNIWLLLTKDTSAFVSTIRDDNRVKYKVSFQDVAFPQRLSGNPFQESEDSPSLHTAFKYSQDYFVISDTGKAYHIGPPARPQWNSDRNVIELPCKQTFVFADGATLLCATQDSQGNWRKFSSNDGRKWAFSGALPLDNRMEPVIITGSRLIGVEKRMKGFVLKAWKGNPDSTYTLTHLFEASEGLLMDIMVEEKIPAVFLLIGKESQVGDLGLSVLLNVLYEGIGK